MGINAVMWFRLDREMTDDEIATVNVDAARAFPSSLCSSYAAPVEHDEWNERTPDEKFLTSDLYFQEPNAKPKGGHWYRIRTPDRYCFVESRRFWPNGPDTLGAESAMEHCDLAAWIEQRIPGAEAWYGSEDDANLRRFDAYARRIRRAYLHLSNAVPAGYHEALPIVAQAKASARTQPARAKFLLELHADRLDGTVGDALRRLAAELRFG